MFVLEPTSFLLREVSSSERPPVNKLEDSMNRFVARFGLERNILTSYQVDLKGIKLGNHKAIQERFVKFNLDSQPVDGNCLKLVESPTLLASFLLNQ